MPDEKIIVAIGGTLRDDSTTEAALRRVLFFADRLGARTRLFSGAQLDLPSYAPGRAAAPIVVRLLDSLRVAAGVVIASPGYHGGISGMVKNVLDYTEEMANDAVPYFTGKPVGCVAAGLGWQGCNSTLHALRSVVHALRGWPTPLGIAFNTATPCFDAQGNCLVPQLEQQFELMAQQLIDFY